MLVKQTAADIRKEVLEADAKKDVNIYLAISIGITSGIAAVAALCAVITSRALVYFRAGIDAYWLSCVPFLFPVVTALFAAYKKQFALLGVHICVNLLALVLGGLSFGASVEPLFVNSHLCLRARDDVSCEKVSLSTLYLISGALAAGFALLNFLLTLNAFYFACKRIARREREARMKHFQEQEEKQKELRQLKVTQGEAQKTRTLSMSSAVSSSNATAQSSSLTQPQNQGPQPEEGAK